MRYLKELIIAYSSNEDESVEMKTSPTKGHNSENITNYEKLEEIANSRSEDYL